MEVKEQKELREMEVNELIELRDIAVQELKEMKELMDIRTKLKVDHDEKMQKLEEDNKVLKYQVECFKVGSKET